MTTFRKNIKFLAIAISLFLFSSLNVNAGSATLNLSGASSVIVGNNIEVIISANNINVTDGIAGFEAKVNYDSNYLDFIDSVSLAKFEVNYENYVSSGMISGMSFSESKFITGTSSNLIKLIFKTKKEGSTNIRINDVEVTEGNKDIANVGGTSKTITINPIPSSNANLSSLSVSSGTINFNKDTTSYSLKVDSDVTSIDISASAEDSGAKVSGIGTKSLNYGDNKISIVVTAPSGSKKTYTITINRKDNRSSNNNLASLKVSTGTLSPSFSVSKTTYNVSVPFDVSSIKVNATAEDSKSKVVVSGGSSLKAGAVTRINVKVTAENGAVKTYIIKVTRGKDPNAQEEKNTNNNLASITVIDGTLSPEFNKNTTSYTLEVPYKVKNLELNPVAEDEAFATVKVEGANNLQVGENEVKIIVTAENGSTKEYTIKVKRAEPTEEDLKNEESDVKPPEEEIKHLLVNVNLTKGKITTKFDSKKFIYYYKKNKGFKIEGIPKDSEDKVTIFEHDDVITIVVGENLEDANVYTFIPKETNILAIVITISSVVFISGGTFLGYKFGIKNKGKTPKKLKKKNNKQEVELPVFGE